MRDNSCWNLAKVTSFFFVWSFLYSRFNKTNWKLLLKISASQSSANDCVALILTLESFFKIRFLAQHQQSRQGLEEEKELRNDEGEPFFCSKAVENIIECSSLFSYFKSTGSAAGNQKVSKELQVGENSKRISNLSYLSCSSQLLKKLLHNKMKWI